MTKVSIALGLTLGLVASTPVVLAEELAQPKTNAEKAQEHKEKAASAKTDVEKEFHEVMADQHEKMAAEEAKKAQ